MVKSRPLAFPLSILLAAGLPALALAQAETEYEARLTESKGDVVVITAESPEGVAGDKDFPLSAGDRVRTGEDSSAEITFSGEHCVSLRSRSELTLTGLQRADTELTLALGSLLARVQALVGGGLRVRTAAAVASVRGTEFGVEVDGEDPTLTHVGVFDEGKVAVEAGGGQPEMLKSNQETSVRRGGRPMPAYQLRHFVPQRQFIRSFRKRVQLVRKAWRPMAAAQRQGKRREMLQKMRQHRLQQLQNARPQKAQKVQKVRRIRADQEKMEQRKRSIREKLRRQ